jgi:hypothetical protein
MLRALISNASEQNVKVEEWLLRTEEFALSNRHAITLSAGNVQGD